MLKRIKNLKLLLICFKDGVNLNPSFSIQQIVFDHLKELSTHTYKIFDIRIAIWACIVNKIGAEKHNDE